MNLMQRKLNRVELIGAQRITSSYKEIPQFQVTISADMINLLDVRKRLKANKNVQAKISITALLINIIAKCLLAHKELNAGFKEPDTVIIKPEINIGVAVDTQKGLIVPVIKNADALDVIETSIQLEKLVDRAREGKMRTDDIAGGTFTVSNLGTTGIENFCAIINPPQTAILAVGSIINRPVCVGEDIVVRPMVELTLTSDHRTVDGAKAARFLANLKKEIEIIQCIS